MKLYKILMLTPLFFINVHAEILEVKVQVDGMVCNGCVLTIKKTLLDKIPELAEVKKIDFKTGIGELKLKKGNNLSQKQLQKKLNAAVKKTAYKFHDLQVEEEN